MELRLSRSCDAEAEVARGQHPDIDVEARLVADMAGQHRAAARLAHVAHVKTVPRGGGGDLPAEARDVVDKLRVPPVAVAAEAHRLPCRSGFGQGLGPRDAAVGIEADHLGLIGGTARLARRRTPAPACPRSWGRAAAVPGCRRQNGPARPGWTFRGHVTCPLPLRVHPDQQHEARTEQTDQRQHPQPRAFGQKRRQADQGRVRETPSPCPTARRGRTPRSGARAARGGTSSSGRPIAARRPRRR
jgi:hypothetical protein